MLQEHGSPTGSARIAVVAACDEGYAVGLCVMVRSVLENLRDGLTLQLFVLDGGITESSKDRMRDSWQEFAPEVHWVRPEVEDRLRHVQRRGHAGVDATYYRLLMAELLPEDVSVAVYLDADVIVTADLGEVLEIPFDGQPVLAVADRYARTLHLPRLTRLSFPLRDLFVDAPDYFNAGVLVVDLDAWRCEGFGETALSLAQKYGEALVFHDQDALNCVFAGRWKALPLTWNFHELPQSLRCWETRGLPAEELQALWRGPHIVHFTSADKPWHAVCLSPFRSLFEDVRSRTAFTETVRPRGRATWLAGEIAHHVELNWLLWRGAVHSVDGPLLRCAAGKVLRRPWMLLTYPAWAAVSWVREIATRRVK